VGVSVTTAMPGCDAVTVTLDGETDSVKFPVAAVMLIEAAVEVDVAKFASPPYCAVIECVPVESVDVEKVVEPEPLSVPGPKFVAPSRNITVPVGTFVPLAGVTLAMNETLAPAVAVAGPVSAVVVETSAAAFTTCDKAGEVLVENFASPLYFAVIECVPCGSVADETVDMPAAIVTGFPICVAPSKNEIVPVNVPAVAEVEVAVKVTDCPTVEGFREDATVVAVAAVPPTFTTCVNAGEVLAAKLASPPYRAVMECEPAASVEVRSVASPPAPTVPVPMDVAPSKNVAVPVMAPAVADVTVAVNVTLAPVEDGFSEDVTAVAVDADGGTTLPFLFSSTTFPTIKSGLPSSFRSVATAPPNADSTIASGAETVPSGLVIV
jgi:hypothetical protein